MKAMCMFNPLLELGCTILDVHAFQFILDDVRTNMVVNVNEQCESIDLFVSSRVNVISDVS